MPYMIAVSLEMSDEPNLRYSSPPNLEYSNGVARNQEIMLH